MQKLLTVTLDAKQVRQACKAFVADMMGDAQGERNDYYAQVRASLGEQGMIVAAVTITKKRVRKPRATT